MKAYAKTLAQAGKKVHYVASDKSQRITHDLSSDCRKLIASLDVKELHIIDVVDDWLRQRINQACADNQIELHTIPTPLFLQPYATYQDFFEQKKAQGKLIFHHEFYTGARKRESILLDENNKPVGGKWSFDADNRKKYPRKQTPPSVTFPEDTEEYAEAVTYVNTHFADHYGSVENDSAQTELFAEKDNVFRYPTTHKQAVEWLDEFLAVRFAEFGIYEDAMVDTESILHHSVLTPMLNIGLLTPRQVIDATLAYSETHNVPINSLEGFIRQIIGWREFMYGLYESVGRQQRTTNYWGFTRKIPKSFYTGDTGIVPVDTTIKKVLKTGYCHHIERLMILGNFMLLCEFDPDEVYQWFMELFIDAYDWVMVPNIYGMSQFADGGLMATKPYISGSNYISKMSNYTVKSKGEPTDWAANWDGLFWRFMKVHRAFFEKNPRIGMLLNMWDKMDAKKQQTHLQRAETFLLKLDNGTV